LEDWRGGGEQNVERVKKWQWVNVCVRVCVCVWKTEVEREKVCVCVFVCALGKVKRETGVKKKDEKVDSKMQTKQSIKLGKIHQPV